VSLNRSTVETPSTATQAPLLAWALNRPQQVLVSLVKTVHNLCDEDDVQCVMFLATEFGMIRPAPFYFSRNGAHEAPGPVSLVLRDTLRELLDSAFLLWENGCLTCAGGVSAVVPERECSFREDLAWIEGLSSQERKALACTALSRQNAGQDHATPWIGLPVETALTRVWG
jgi:hypothetical protein